MKKKIEFSISLVLLCFKIVLGQEEPLNQLSNEAQSYLETKGFKILGVKQPLIKLPDSLTQEKNIIKLEVSVDLSIQMQIVKDSDQLKKSNQNISKETEINTLFSEDFEGDFPGNRWQLLGHPSWGKEKWTSDSFNPYGTSCGWCAGDGLIFQPWQYYTQYLPNMDNKMIAGPFDLRGGNVACLSFEYNIQSEPQFDWFYWLASIDGIEFSGYAVSGRVSTIGFSGMYWIHEVFDLSNVPELGDITNRQSVWIAFGFMSNENEVGLYDYGAFVDNIVLWKTNGTVLSDYLNGNLNMEGNP